MPNDVLGMGQTATPSPDSQQPSQPQAARKYTMEDWNFILQDPRYQADEDNRKLQIAYQFFNDAVASDPRYQQDTPERQDEILREFQKTIPVSRSIKTSVQRGSEQAMASIYSGAQAVAQKVGLPQGAQDWLAFQKYKSIADAQARPSAPEERPVYQDPSQLLSPSYLARKTAETLPALGTTAAVGLLAGALGGAPAAMIAGGAAGALFESGNLWQEEWQKGAQAGESIEVSKERAFNRFATSFLASAALNSPLFGMLFKEGVAPGIKALAWRMFKAGAVESATEYIEELSQAVIQGTPIGSEEFKRKALEAIDVVAPSAILGVLTGVSASGVRANLKDLQLNQPGEDAVTETTGTAPSMTAESPGTLPAIETAEGGIGYESIPDLTKWESLSPEERALTKQYTPGLVPVEVQEQEEAAAFSPVETAEGTLGLFDAQEAQGKEITSQPIQDIAPGAIEPVSAFKGVLTIGSPFYNRELVIRTQYKNGKVYEGPFTVTGVNEEKGTVLGKHGTGKRVYEHSLEFTELPTGIQLTDTYFRSADPKATPAKVETPMQDRAVGKVESPVSALAFEQSRAEREAIDVIPPAVQAAEAQAAVSEVGTSVPKVGIPVPITYIIGQPGRRARITEFAPGVTVEASPEFLAVAEALEKAIPGLDLHKVARIEAELNNPETGTAYWGEAYGSTINRTVYIALEQFASENTAVAGQKAAQTFKHEGLHVWVSLLAGDPTIQAAINAYDGEEAFVRAAEQYYNPGKLSTAEMTQQERIADAEIGSWIDRVWQAIVEFVRDLNPQKKALFDALKLIENEGMGFPEGTPRDDLQLKSKSRDDLLTELAEVEAWLANPPVVGGKPVSPALVQRFEQRRENLYAQIAQTPAFDLKGYVPVAADIQHGIDQIKSLGEWAKNAGAWVADTFSVQAATKRGDKLYGGVLGKHIGEQLRRFWSVIGSYEDWGLNSNLKQITALLAQIHGGKITMGVLHGLEDKAAFDKDMIELGLIYESKERQAKLFADRPDKAAAYKQIFSYLENWQKSSLELLKQHGVTDDFKLGFERRAMDDIQVALEENKDWSEQLLKTKSVDTRHRLEQQIAENEKLIADTKADLKRLQDLNYLPMPTAILNQSKLLRTRKGRAAALRFLTARQRNTLFMQDLLAIHTDKDGNIVPSHQGKPVFTEKDFSLPNIIAAYSQKLGRDLGTSRVLNAGMGKVWTRDPNTGQWGYRVAGYWKEVIDKKKKGAEKRTGKWDWVSEFSPGDEWVYRLKRPDEPLRDGFVKIRSEHGSYVEQFAMREPLAEWFDAQAFKNYEETLNPVWKLLRVVKMAAFYNPIILPAYNLYQAWQAGALGSLFSGKVWKQTLKSIRERDANYYEFHDLGAPSNPFGMTRRGMIDEANRIAKTNPELHGFMKLALPYHGLKYAYQMSWNWAWAGDRAMRLFTYNHLKAVGHSAEEAASLTAEFFGDYANVPQGTRVFLNKLFFTPTFKIATARTQARMISSAFKWSKNTLQGKETDLGTTQLAQGLVWSVGALFLTHMMMSWLGFKDDKWGWKYSKNVETEDGVKELVVTWSNPLNALIKFPYRLGSATEAGEFNSAEKFLQASSWEIHPLWRAGYSMLVNRNERGEVISNPFDSWGKQTFDSTWYGFSRSIAVLGKTEDLLAGDPDVTKAKRALWNDVNGIAAFTVQLAGFHYLRSPEELRAQYKIRNVVREFKAQTRKDLLKAETPADLDKARERLQKHMMRMQEMIAEIAREVE